MDDTLASYMNLKTQVCSLELAMRLKELGVKQESYFAWYKEGDVFEMAVQNNVGISRFRDNVIIPPSHGMREYYAAFTVAELGDVIREANLEDLIFMTDCSTREWRVWLGDPNADEFPFTFDPSFIESTEADARAKMLIYLLENKLIPSSLEA